MTLETLQKAKGIEYCMNAYKETKEQLLPILKRPEYFDLELKGVCANKGVHLTIEHPQKDVVTKRVAEEYIEWLDKRIAELTQELASL